MQLNSKAHRNSGPIQIVALVAALFASGTCFGQTGADSDAAPPDFGGAQVELQSGIGVETFGTLDSDIQDMKQLLLELNRDLFLLEE